MEYGSTPLELGWGDFVRAKLDMLTCILIRIPFSS